MYQLLARMVSFRANIGQLLGSVRTHLSDASQPKVYNKLSSLLQHASRGIMANPTAQPQDLMVFVHGVLEGGLAQEEAAREAAEAVATAAVRRPGKLCSSCFCIIMLLYDHAFVLSTFFQDHAALSASATFNTSDTCDSSSRHERFAIDDSLTKRAVWVVADQRYAAYTVLLR